MNTVLENVDSYFMEVQPPCKIEDIESLEIKWAIKIPQQFRMLLLKCNGGDLDYGYRHIKLLSILEENVVEDDFMYDISNIAQIESGLLNGYEVSNMDSILYLGCSDAGCKFFIGHTGEFKDKVYWSSGLPWEDGVENAEGIFIQPIRFLANTLEEFFLMLGPAPEE